MNNLARTIRALFTPVALAWLLPAGAATVTNTYDLTADWSNTQNPNGAWSYNYNSSPITTFQTFRFGRWFRTENENAERPED